jgi:hypothetical protein
MWSEYYAADNIHLFINIVNDTVYFFIIHFGSLNFILDNLILI